MPPPPKSLANLKRGGQPGRAPGVPNKATQDIKAIATRLVSDPGYVASLEVRLKRGTAGPVELALFHYAYGPPKKDDENVNLKHSGTVGFRWMYRHESDDHDPE